MKNQSPIGIRVAAFVLCLVVSQICLLQSSWAQGTMGTLPDPITSRELDSYADRLGLSSEQRRAVERFYQQYHENFRRLRDNEIADFLNAMQDMQRAGMQMPSRAEVEKFGRLWDRARDRIRAVDEQFFNVIQVALTDKQLPMVDRIRMARERTRYNSAMNMGMTGRVTDLSVMLQHMNLSPDEHEQVDPLLAEYERRLTLSMRRQNEASASMMFDMFDAMEEAGFNEDSMSDPEQMQAIMQESQRIMGEIFGRMAEHNQQIRSLNDRTYRMIAGILEEQRRRLFRDAFVRGAYMEIHFAASSHASQRFAAALTLDNLEADLRDRIQSAQQAFEAERDVAVDRAMRFAHDNYRSPMAFMFPRGDDDSYQSELDALREQFTRLDSQGAQMLDELLPQDKQEQARAAASDGSRRVIERTMDSNGTTTTVIVNDAPASPSSDQFVPEAISSHDLTIYADLMNMDNDYRVLMEQLHADYQRRFEQRMAGPFQQLAEASRMRWQGHGESQEQGTVTNRITHLYELRRKVTAEVIALDESFFDDLELVMPDVPLDRARLARTRMRSSASTRFTPDGSRVSGLLDLSDIVRLLRWSNEQRGAVTDELTRWEIEMGTLMPQYFDALLATEEAQEVFFASLQDMNDPSQWHDFNERREQALGAKSRKLRDLREALRRKTEQARDAIVAKLSAEDAAVFDDAYRRRAFPQIYNDRRAMHDLLRSALNISGLPQDRRDALMEVNLSYNSRYYDLTERMVQLRSGPSYDMFNMTDQAEMADYLEAESNYARLTFERDELSEWAARELRGMLSEEQRELIGMVR